jgi:hypothetical protein
MTRSGTGKKPERKMVEMNGKIRTLLASAVALGLLAMPAAAQATTQQAPIGTALKAGAPFKMQAENLPIWMEGEEGEKGPTVMCKHAELTGEVISNGIEKPKNKISGSKFSNCLFAPWGGTEWSVDISSNAKENPWSLEFQQPKGTYTAHMLPEATNKIRIKAQVQAMGFDIETCVYAAEPPNPNTPVDFFGFANSNVLETGWNTFELQAGAPGLCGVTATMGGFFTMTSGANGVTVDEK